MSLFLTTIVFFISLYLYRAHPLRQRTRAATSPKVGGFDRMIHSLHCGQVCVHTTQRETRRTLHYAKGSPFGRAGAKRLRG